MQAGEGTTKEGTTGSPREPGKVAPLELVVNKRQLAIERWATQLQRERRIYTKTAGVHAKVALESGTIETIVNGAVEKSTAVEKGDYIMYGTRGGEYPMGSLEFAKRYDVAKVGPALDPALAKDGFELFQPKGQVFAHLLDKYDMSLYFSTGVLVNKFGTHPVHVGDALAMPFPNGGEVYVIRNNLFAHTYLYDAEKSCDAKQQPELKRRLAFYFARCLVRRD